MFSYMKSFFHWSLSKLGVNKRKESTILFIGLDNSGKTSLLHLLSNHRVSSHIPTQNPTSNQFIIDNITFNAYDLGGHKSIRRLWDDYLYNVDAIVYLIDAYDRDRLIESKLEFNKLITNSKLTQIPILVLGNKIDLPQACSEEELKNILGIEDYESNLKLFMCSIINKYNIVNAFQWVSSKI